LLIRRFTVDVDTNFLPKLSTRLALPFRIV
jgi:hypothetical protein